MKYLLLQHNLAAIPCHNLEYDNITHKPAVRRILELLGETGAEGMLLLDESRILPRSGDLRTDVTPYALVTRVSSRSLRIKKLFKSPDARQRGLPGTLYHSV